MEDSLAVGSASDQQLPIGIPLRLPSSTVKELEFALVEIASLAQQEQMCFGMCDALQQKANTFTRIVVVDDLGEGGCVERFRLRAKLPKLRTRAVYFDLLL